MQPPSAQPATLTPARWVPAPSKWAVRGLTKSAALELGHRNIRVNAIHPGFIRTPMIEHFPEDMLILPLSRPGTSEEVATFVVFVASDESSYVARPTPR